MSTTYITNTPIGTPGSLRSLMDGLVALQAQLPTIADPAGLDAQLTLYRWRPDIPDAPCLYNMLRPSTTEQRDLIRVRDTIVVATRIGMSYSDADTLNASVEAYVDSYRALVDANYWDGQRTPPPLKGSATWAMRSSMQSFADNFGETTLQGIEITQSFWLDRHVR